VIKINAKKALKGLFNQPAIQNQVYEFRAEKIKNSEPKLKNHNGEIIPGPIPDWAQVPYKEPQNDHKIETYKELTNITNVKPKNKKYKIGID